MHHDPSTPVNRACLQLQSGALSAYQRLAIIGKFLLYLRKNGCRYALIKVKSLEDPGGQAQNHPLF
jgi:hypothetical protein